MKKYILLLVFLWTTMGSFAHSPDASTIVLAEQKNNVWVLQINASLTAFQQEVRTHFAETPYKTPEEFQEMVISHIKNNLQFTFNNGEQIILGKGVVKLGHETKVVFEVLNLPTEITSVNVSNKVFSDINRNQSTLMIFKEGFAKDHFTLDKTNDHTITLVVKDNKFIEKTEQNAGVSPSLIILGLIASICLGLLIKNILLLREKSVSENI